MDLNSEKQRPQKVEVVNNPSNPTQTQITNFPYSSDGTSLLVRVQNPITLSNRSTSSSNYNVYLENILLLQSDGTFVPVPLCAYLTSVTNAQLESCLQSYKTAYATLVANITAATLHYCKIANNGATTSEVFNLKD